VTKLRISQHAKDLIQKYTSSLFKDATLEFYGVKTARIVELINTELPTVEVAGGAADFVFLLEDGTYFHFEFQTTYNAADLLRFAGYDIRLYERDGRKVVTVIIYTADVKHRPAGLDIGSPAYNPSVVMMHDYDGVAIYESLRSKLADGQNLSDVDMLNLIFLPLMRHMLPRKELAENSIELAQTIPDSTKRNTCIAAVFAFSSKYLSKDEAGQLLEVLKMTDLAEMLVDKVISEREIEIAKNALREGAAIDFVKKITGLDETTIKRLQMEIRNA